MKLDKDGKPVDKSYLECNLPSYLAHDLNAYKQGLKDNSTLLDCLHGELYGSINGAYHDGQITEEQADYLRNKYLWGNYDD